MSDDNYIEVPIPGVPGALVHIDLTDKISENQVEAAVTIARMLTTEYRREFGVRP